jgi:hypothetical protein
LKGKSSNCAKAVSFEYWASLCMVKFDVASEQAVEPTHHRPHRIWRPRWLGRPCWRAASWRSSCFWISHVGVDVVLEKWLRQKIPIVGEPEVVGSRLADCPEQMHQASSKSPCPSLTESLSPVVTFRGGRVSIFRVWYTLCCIHRIQYFYPQRTDVQELRCS